MSGFGHPRTIEGAAKDARFLDGSGVAPWDVTVPCRRNRRGRGRNAGSGDERVVLDGGDSRRSPGRVRSARCRSGCSPRLLGGPCHRCPASKASHASVRSAAAGALLPPHVACWMACLPGKSPGGQTGRRHPRGADLDLSRRHSNLPDQRFSHQLPRRLDARHRVTPSVVPDCHCGRCSVTASESANTQIHRCDWRRIRFSADARKVPLVGVSIFRGCSKIDWAPTRDVITDPFTAT
jgi:hypothetical protein